MEKKGNRIKKSLNQTKEGNIKSRNQKRKKETFKNSRNYILKNIDWLQKSY